MAENTPRKQPLKPKSDNPSQNSRLHAATDIQSSVEPQDYPAADRAEQTAAVGKVADRKKEQASRRPRQ